MRIKLNLLTLITIIVVMCSCTVQKRTHRGGYYIDWKKQSKNDSQMAALKIQKDENVAAKNLIASISSIIEFESGNNHIVRTVKATNICGDTLYLATGAKIICTVLVIGETEIEYKECDNLNGEASVLNRELINKISFVNGTYEIINQDEESETISNELGIDKEITDCKDSLFFKNGKIIICTILNSDQNNIQYKTCDSLNKSDYHIEREKLHRWVKTKTLPINLKPQDSIDLKPQKKFHPFAIASFGGSILCFILMLAGFANWTSGLFITAVIVALLAFIFGRIASSFIDANKEKYKGKGLIIFSLILSIVSIVALLFGPIFFMGMG